MADAAALAADGVVGIHTELLEDEHGLFEVVLRGTAVRARNSRRGLGPERLFTTDLDGAQVAALVTHGWAPVCLVWGFSVGSRPTDWVAAQQRHRFAENQEVAGDTDLVTRVRADARDQLTARARRAGADGVLASAITLRQRSELICEALIRGTAIARAAHTGRTTSPARPLTVLPLRRGPEAPQGAATPAPG